MSCTRNVGSDRRSLGLRPLGTFVLITKLPARGFTTEPPVDLNAAAVHVHAAIPRRGFRAAAFSNQEFSAFQALTFSLKSWCCQTSRSGGVATRTVSDLRT